MPLGARRGVIPVATMSAPPCVEAPQRRSAVPMFCTSQSAVQAVQRGTCRPRRPAWAARAPIPRTPVIGSDGRADAVLRAGSWGRTWPAAGVRSRAFALAARDAGPCSSGCRNPACRHRAMFGGTLGASVEPFLYVLVPVGAEKPAGGLRRAGVLRHPSSRVHGLRAAGLRRGRVGASGVRGAPVVWRGRRPRSPPGLAWSCAVLKQHVNIYGPACGGRSRTGSCCCRSKPS